ncbi:50S ribosomal protein L9 [Chromatiales bacterium (ex Bugula neritina AB1)]|nr:50S ribosomal protein L9 [Chromatiales bacterium (ex Bugula neritina AB1)]
MQVILLEKISNVGSLGDLVDVKPGFARNYLLPLGKAQMATKQNLEDFEQRRAEYEAEQIALLNTAKQRAAGLEGSAVTVLARAGNEGKLFGSVGAEEIASAFVANGTPVEKRELRLPEGPLRNTGEHEVTVHIHPEVDVIVKVNVEGEDG